MLHLNYPLSDYGSLVRFAFKMLRQPGEHSCPPVAEVSQTVLFLQAIVSLLSRRSSLKEKKILLTYAKLFNGQKDFIRV